MTRQNIWAGFLENLIFEEVSLAAVYSLTAKRVKIVLKSDDNKAKTRSENRRRHRICVSVNLIGSRSTKISVRAFLKP